MTQLRDQLQATLSGAYTLDRELSGGGMSRVFLADELRLGRKVVVKVLSPELAAGISAERFELEIKLAASLQQANIVPVLSAGDTNGLPFYTMPFVEGESLRVRLGKQPALGITDILRIMGDVARALQYAHERGIVHRDIKPDNVLLSGGTAVVTDFGIAKALSAAKRSGRDSAGSPDLSALTVMGTSIGTPAYMSPEQAAGDPDVDHRADIYAFGCMAYELLAGRPPFHSRTPQRILAAHMSESPPPLIELRPDVPATLSDLIMRTLDKDPGARPQSAADIVHSLDGVTSASGMTAMPTVLLHGPAAFRRALLIYAACAVGVIVVAKAATIVIGLPDWVVPSSIFVMALGLPVILFTGYVQSVTRHAMTVTPAMTPGGGTMPHGTMATIALKASPHLSWKRATRGGIYAFAAFVALVIGFMVTRAMGIGPAASLFAKGVLTEQDRVLVADFEAPPSDTSIGTVVSEGVRSNLSQSRAISVVPTSQVTAALTRMQKPATTRIDYATARDLALREGYKAIVDGKVTPVSDGSFIVSVRLLSAENGDELASFREVARDASGLIPVIDKLTKDLRGKVGESLRTVRAAPTLEHATTASLPALRKYTEGVRANAIEQNYLAAIAALEEAIRLDTTFAQAYRLASMVYGNAGLKPDRAALLREKAFQHREHLPESERFLMEGTYYATGASVDRQKAIQAYRRVLALDPANDVPYNNLALLYSSQQQYAQAESLYVAGALLSPTNAFLRTNLIGAQLNQGRVDDAITTWNTFRRDFPNNPGSAGWSAIAAKYGIDSVHTECRRAAATENLQARANALACAYSVTLTKGQLSSAFAGLRGIIEADSARGVQGVGFDIFYRVNEANAAAWFQGRQVYAARIIDEIVPKVILVDPPPFMRGAPGAIVEAYSLADRPDKARAYFDKWVASLDTSRRRISSAGIHLALGRIAVAEKKYDVAIRELQAADTSYDGRPTGCAGCNLPELGRVYDLAGQPDAAIQTFEKYLATPYAGRWLARDPIYLAGIYKRLGELYEAKGDAARAVKYLTKFVELWADADAELQPRVTEAKARLARLQRAEARRR